MATFSLCVCVCVPTPPELITYRHWIEDLYLSLLPLDRWWPEKHFQHDDSLTGSPDTIISDALVLVYYDVYMTLSPMNGGRAKGIAALSYRPKAIDFLLEFNRSPPWPSGSPCNILFDIVHYISSINSYSEPIVGRIVEKLWLLRKVSWLGLYSGFFAHNLRTPVCCCCQCSVVLTLAFLTFENYIPKEGLFSIV